MMLENHVSLINFYFKKSKWKDLNILLNPEHRGSPVREASAVLQ